LPWPLRPVDGWAAVDDITQLRVGRTVRVSGAPCSGYPYEHPDRGGTTAARAFLDRRQKSMLNYHQGLSVIRNHAQLFSGGGRRRTLLNQSSPSRLKGVWIGLSFFWHHLKSHSDRQEPLFLSSM